MHPPRRPPSSLQSMFPLAKPPLVTLPRPPPGTVVASVAAPSPGLRRPASRQWRAGAPHAVGFLLQLGSPPTKLNHGDIVSFTTPPHNDDVRRLEKSNVELREQLEAHVVTIEILRTEIKIAQVQHEKELKELQNSIKDLDERLSASKQSHADADEIIQSQKASVCELEGQLSEERNLRIEERDKAAEDLKSALHKVQSEAQEEIKRQTEAYHRQQREQKEFISKLHVLLFSSNSSQTSVIAYFGILCLYVLEL